MKKLVFIPFILALLSISVLVSPTKADSSTVKVLFVTSSNGSNIDMLIDHFRIDPQFNFTITTTLNSDINNFDAIIFLDYVPDSSEQQLIENYNGGAITFIGPNIAKNPILLQYFNITFTLNSNTLSSEYVLPQPTSSNGTHPLITNIVWNSVPTVTNFTLLNIENETVLVETTEESKIKDIPLIIEYKANNYIINIWPNMDYNKEFVEWPYFNYFLYILLSDVTNRDISTYADWPYSPVPHDLAVIGIGIMVVLTSVITGLAYVYAKRYSTKHKIIEKDLEEISKEVKVEKEWEDIGMHRQLGGFLVQLFVGLIILLPNVVMSSMIFPLYVLPSPQGAGFYDYTIHFFEGLWLLFDLGTSVVLVKFFSEHRVKRPEQAIKYVQIFVWYQMISGVLQLILVSFIGAIVFPRTFLAHMTWLFITHSFFQWPAFFLVFMYLFQAMNRHDYYQILNLLLYGIFNITLQYLVIIIFRVTLGKNIIFGDSLAGAIGYSMGNYVNMVATFLVGLWMFKRLGFSLKTIFRVDFRWNEIKEALLFGFKWTLGNIWPPMVWFLQMFLLSFYLPNYTQQQGYFSIAWNLSLIVMLVSLFGQSMLPGVSESYHAEKKALTRYYTVSALKWGAFFDVFFVSALLAVGPKFILGGAGKEWQGAAILIPWLMLFHFFGYWSWIGDWMFAGSDRPGWAAISWIIEQVTRAVLLIVLIPAYSFFTTNFNSPLVAVLFAYIPALVIKNIFMWWQIRRNDYFKFAWSDLLWQGIIAPILTGVIYYGILEGLFFFIWQGEIITSVISLILGLILGLYLYGLIYSALGGFDNNTLQEFHRATDIVKGVGFMAKPLYKACSFGARISPLHNKFPIKIFSQAAKEAEILTNEKKKLII